MAHQRKKFVMMRLGSTTEEHNENVVRFWELVRRAADYDARAAEAEEYYSRGYCGGCGTCPSAPADVSPEELEEIWGGFQELFLSQKGA